MKKDAGLRTLAIAAYIVSLYFSYISTNINDVLVFLWGFASLLYWWLAYEFEKRDRNWEKEDKKES